MTHRTLLLASFALLALPFLAACSTATKAGVNANGITTTSPDGRLEVVIATTNTMTATGDNTLVTWRAFLDGELVTGPNQIGLTLADADLASGLTITGATRSTTHTDEYETLTSKRRHNTYTANERTITLENPAGDPLEFTLRVSDDGLGFRYTVPAEDDRPIAVESEATTYTFAPDARAWISPMSVAKTGWERTNPSYEEYYEFGVPVASTEGLGVGWVYPALVRSGAPENDDAPWVLISEAGLDRTHCGTRLVNAGPSTYRVGFPDPRETMDGAPVNPHTTGAWSSPWRVVAIGDLETITESMLGVHLARPAEFDTEDWMQPGQSSWSWVLLKDGQTIEPVQRRFIDYAADMGWEYCLIDCDWDRKIGFDRLQALVDHATQRGVKVVVWYNSSGDWNGTPYTPRDQLLTEEDRDATFARLHEMGVAGVKVDFFGGDGQRVINHYIDILEAAHRHKLVVNFHGATLPRGWHRTYPHLMTVEAVRGMEFTTFEQRNADRTPAHAAMQPYTRNVYDPMDFTPTALDTIPNINRRNSAAFELATAILFTSGVQHIAEIPEGMAKAPKPVRTLMSNLPGVWEEVEFLGGHPGSTALFARRGGGRWYIAGINATDEPATFEADLSELVRADGSPVRNAMLFTDGGSGPVPITTRRVTTDRDNTLTIEIAPKGGVTLVFEE